MKFDSQVVSLQLRVEWKFVSAINGVLYATRCGITLMLVLSADNWDLLLLVCIIAIYSIVWKKFVLSDIEALNETLFGEGTGRIWLDNVQCTGSERALMNCTASSSGVNSCTHAQDAGVRCQSGKNCDSKPTISIFITSHAILCNSCQMESVPTLL